MGVPSVVKIKKGNVEYTGKVDIAQYTIRELTRAALRDVGRYVVRQCTRKARRLDGLGRTRYIQKRFQFWVRKQETDLQVGIRNGTWYGTDQELGSKNQPKRGILRNSVYNNIHQIIEIESQYLSALESEAAALAKISEEEYQGGGDD